MNQPSHNHHYNQHQTPKRQIQNSMRFTPQRNGHFTPNRKPSEKLISTPSRLMTPNRTPTRAGYSPGGVYQNRPLSPYNFTPGGTQVQTKINELSRETMTMISDAKKDFKNPVLEDIEVDNFATKIEVSQDGNKVYYAGDGIGELHRGSDLWLYNKGMINRLCKFKKSEFEELIILGISTVKTLEDGRIIVCDMKNWDLVIYDSEFN